jgi:hypothetical protein
MSKERFVRAVNRGAVTMGLAALVVLPLIWAAGAAAQISTAVLDIQTVDQAGVPLPGVTVVLTQPATGLQRTGVTDSDGFVEFAALAPGTYTLNVNLPGFSPVTEENIVLRVGQTARVRATLQAAMAEEVMVTAQAPMVDVHKMDSSTNITPEQIQSLPVENRDFERLAFIAPGVERERGSYRFIQNGPVIGAGGNASQATIMVDGVDFTDPVNGLARARFSQDAIREFRVINNRFDTEIGQSAGGALSIVTKSGSNLFAGSVFGFYRSDKLRSIGALENANLPTEETVSGRKKAPYKRGQYGFTLGGPIVRDQTFYYLSTEYINEDNITLFRPGGAFADLAANVKHPFDQTLLFGSLDHMMSNSQRLNARFVYERYREDNFRVGGVSDQSWGLHLNRDNWNLTFEHVLIPNPSYLNELRIQVGSHKYDEPTNSDAVEEWFSSGNTLKTGTNTTGHLLGKGDVWEVRDTAHLYSGEHAFKMGIAVEHAKERSRIDNFSHGTFTYLTDTRAIPVAYLYGIGSSDVTKSTSLYSAFIQDDWRPNSKLTVNYGLRYDLDTDGNNPDFDPCATVEGPCILDGLITKRHRDTNNIQPRAGFSWDVTGRGNSVLRGGVGRFTGRYLFIPSIIELQQNGVTGRRYFTRVNGALYWPLCPLYGITDPLVCAALFPALDPSNPATTGILLAPQVGLIANSLKAPQADQATLGWTIRLGNSNLYFDTEAVYVEGKDEIVVRDMNWSGNATHTRPISTLSNINTYTNDGRSRYKALVFSLNGTLPGGHILASSVTFADKKNIADDFSPVYPYGYPSDPADIGAEWGRSRGDDRFRFVVSAIFQLPWQLTVAPIYQYASGQPWNRLIGVDYNGDGFISDRFPGVERNSMDGPPFRQLDLRITKAIDLGAGKLEVIVEAFNLFNTVNYDVTSINNAEYLSYPTISAPANPTTPNPKYGTYNATFPGREIQLGLRYAF